MFKFSIIRNHVHLEIAIPNFLLFEENSPCGSLSALSLVIDGIIGSYITQRRTPVTAVETSPQREGVTFPGRMTPSFSLHSDSRGPLALSEPFTFSLPVYSTCTYIFTGLDREHWCATGPALWNTIPSPLSFNLLRKETQRLRPSYYLATSRHYKNGAPGIRADPSVRAAAGSRARQKFAPKNAANKGG